MLGRASPVGVVLVKVEKQHLVRRGQERPLDNAAAAFFLQVWTVRFDGLAGLGVVAGASPFDEAVGQGNAGQADHQTDRDHPAGVQPNGKIRIT